MKTINNLKFLSIPITACLFVFLFLFIQGNTHSVSAANPESQPPRLATVTSEPFYEFEVINNIVYGQGLRREGWGAEWR